MSRVRFAALPAVAAIAFAAVSGPFFVTAASAQTGDLAQLHDALHLTHAQEDAWRAFSSASQPDPEQQARDSAAREMLARLTSPQRVDLSIAAVRADLETLERRGAAVKAFYATLSPSQQAIFDRETAPKSQQP
jgi:LTXXQ motif family protein